MRRPGHGRLILLTGLSGAGKTTLGYQLVRYLSEFGNRPAYLLDGDTAREFFASDLGYAPEQRDQAARRMAFGASLLVEQGVDVVMANIAGARATREFLRDKFADYVEVHLDVNVQTLIEHDVKGVYTAALKSPKPQLVGVDLPYEAPEAPHVRVFPFQETPEQSLRKIIEYLVSSGPTIGTKADTLQSLRGRLRNATVLPQLTLTSQSFQRNVAYYVDLIRDQFDVASVAVRSSCTSEDAGSGSNAGMFTSVLNVAVTAGALAAAVKAVRDDYEQQGVSRPGEAQILVQPMLSAVRWSGVAFTRHEHADSPYYVINFDDVTGKTDTVTSGAGGETIFISRFAEPRKLGRWTKTIEVLRELEALFPSFPLDVELAELADGEIVVLQCRRLSVGPAPRSLEQHAGELIQELKLRFERCQLAHPPLVGSRTILSDMADWNPAEMLGEKPNTLAHSIYREIITEEVWHRARASQGYFDLRSCPLMLSIGRKSYVDVRASFNSFTPAAIAGELREKLVEHYLTKLEQNPALHDKIEFEIAFTCYDLTLETRIVEVPGLTASERTALIDALRAQTNRLVGQSVDTIPADIAKLNELDGYADEIAQTFGRKTQFFELFHAAYLLLEQTKVLGTLSFARLARLGFIAKTLLRSLEDAELVSPGVVGEVLASVPTVASELRRDMAALQGGKLPLSEFLRCYGHLRMNTYNITAPRYDQLPPDTWQRRYGGSDQERDPSLQVLLGGAKAVDGALHRHGLAFDARALGEFVTAATQARERGKFRFTRALSDALEYLARAGEVLGLSRDDLQYVPISTLLRFRNPELASPAKAAAYLRSRISEKRNERSAYDLVKLPALLASADDIDFVRIGVSRPNFVTRKKVVADVVVVTPTTDPRAVELAGKIVVIESADPGYDWIFTRSPAGLITRYGGAASHMAIRCFELELPGAIGCGETLFNLLTGARLALLDCGAKVIERL
jgi:adenylylsulfate kinase-like enzyme/phosphohistidine swiveling domain-containing protein